MRGKEMFRANKKVWNLHKDLIKTEMGSIQTGYVGSFYSPALLAKLEILSKKYKISRSALLRILLAEVPADYLEKKIEKALSKAA